jgi:hypothetical protein
MNSFQDVFDRQKRYFATGVTRSYAWRIEQLDRMGRMLAENEERLQKAIAADFKPAGSATMAAVRAPPSRPSMAAPANSAGMAKSASKPQAARHAQREDHTSL